MSISMMNATIKQEDNAEELRGIAQELLGLLVLADAAQVAEARARILEDIPTTLPESIEYGLTAEAAPKWIRDELDWETFPVYLRPR